MAEKKTIKVVRATGEKVVSETLDELEVPLTNDEQRLRGLELAKLEVELRELEMGLAAARQQAKEKEAKIQARRHQLVNAIQTKREPRAVRVQHIAKYDVGQLDSVRTDTGEVIGVRQLLSSELQSELPLHGESVG